MTQWSWEKTVKEEATTDDTIALVNQTVFDYAKSPFVVNLTEKLSAEIASKSGDPTMNFLRALFAYCCDRIQYERDPEGWERVWTPELTFKVGKGDCKKFTVIIGACLTAKGIPGFARVVSYDGEKREHIYAIAAYPKWPQYVTLDPVNNKMFNCEPTHAINYTYTFDGKLHRTQRMKLSQMGGLNFSNTFVNRSASGVLDELDGIGIGFGGIGCPTPLNELYGLAGIGDMDDDPFAEYLGKKQKKTKEERKEKRKEIFNQGKTFGFAPARGAFLLIVESGQLLKNTPLKMHLAEKLAAAWKKNKSGLESLWKKFGGNPEALKKAIIKGSGQQLSGMGLFGLGFDPASITVALATATPVVIAVKKFLNDTGVVASGSPEDKALADTAAEGEERHTDSGKPPVLPKPVAAALIKKNKEEAATPGGGGPGAQGNLLADCSALSLVIKTIILVIGLQLMLGSIPLIVKIAAPLLAVAFKYGFTFKKKIHGFRNNV